MYSNSIFGDLVKLLPGDAVAESVARHDGDKWRKRFKTYDHLLAMLAGQLAGAGSLRELETVFNAETNHHYHLRTDRVSRSTLADANRGRPAAVFRDIARDVIGLAGRKQRRAGEIVSILDSTPVRLCGRGHAWADETRPGNPGLKVHVQMDHGTQHLVWAEISDNRMNDITKAREIPLEAGHVYVFDKGYCDYNWWKAIADKGSRFVTRLKRNAAFETVETRKIANQDDGFILQDRVIRLCNKNPGARRRNLLTGAPLRLVRIKHPKGEARPFWIVSNDLEAPASQIAHWYKARWAIELLFKWIKQNLKIKKFMGESRNAVMIQIYVAIIAYVLLKLYHGLNTRPETVRLKDMVSLVRTHLFSRPKIQARRRQRIDQQNKDQLVLWNAT